MIAKYRNRAIARTAIGFGCFVLGISALAAAGRPANNFGIACFTLSGIAGMIFYIWGCIDLAKAKGYGSAQVAAIIIVGGLCCNLLIIFAPLIILFGLEDKTSARPNWDRKRR